VFRHVVHPLFHQQVVAPNIKKIASDRRIIDTVLQDVQPKIFGYLESQIAGKFLVGSGLTLADIAVLSNFLTYQYMGFRIDASRYPTLARYLRDLAGLELFQRALAQEKPFVEQMGLDHSFLN
jgi:glutathione S-transferase